MKAINRHQEHLLLYAEVQPAFILDRCILTRLYNRLLTSYSFLSNINMNLVKLIFRSAVEFLTKQAADVK